MSRVSEMDAMEHIQYRMKNRDNFYTNGCPFCKADPHRLSELSFTRGIIVYFKCNECGKEFDDEYDVLELKNED